MTPSADVVDLGTEFGVRVGDSGDSEVQVFEGSVELQDKGNLRGAGPKYQLVVGQGMRVDRSGTSRAIDVDPESFVGVKELERRSSSEAELRYRAWRVSSQKLQADPHLLLYYTFEGQQPWERTLRNQVAGRTSAGDGGIVGSQWAEGRWPGKGALEFKRPSDRVRLNLPGRHQALTLMAWVRVDGFDRLLNSLLLSDGWWTPGKMHWEIRNDGRFIFAINPEPYIYSNDVVFGTSQFGLWTHLASVLDPKNLSMSHYLNGRLLDTKKIESGAWLEIGWAEVGNWSYPDAIESSTAPRNFNGRIDELAIYDRALGASEIREIYELGKPGS